METIELAGKIAFKTVHAEDYCAWAVTLLEQGLESESLQILAAISLDKTPDSWEVGEHFRKTVAELHIVMPPAPEAIRAYARFLCEAIVKGTLSPAKGLGELEGFWRQSNHQQSLFSIWEKLADDIQTLQTDGYYLWNSGLSLGGEDSFIKAVAVQFIELLDVQLPEGFFHLVHCGSCGHIGAPSAGRAEKNWMPASIFKIIYGHMPALRAICEVCREPFPRDMSDYHARAAYLVLRANHSLEGRRP